MARHSNSANNQSQTVHNEVGLLTSTLNEAQQRSNGLVLAFTGSKHILHGACVDKFLILGISYHSVNQFVQYHKARFYGYHTLAAGLLHSWQPSLEAQFSSAVEACRAPTAVHEQQWNSFLAYDLTYLALLARASQNRSFHTFLKLTGNQQLALCEKDQSHLVWSSGCCIDNANCMKPSRYRGTNKYAFLLQEVRFHCYYQPELFNSWAFSGFLREPSQTLCSDCVQTITRILRWLQTLTLN